MRYDETISAEIENSIINVDNSEIEGRIREYLRHVMAYNRKEKVRNELTGRDSDPDDKLMRRIEALMDVEDTERDFFRFKMVSRLTNALTGGTGHAKPPDGGTAKIDFFEVYSDVFKAIHRSLYREKRDKINWSNVKRDVEKHSSREQFDKLVEKRARPITPQPSRCSTTWKRPTATATSAPDPSYFTLLSAVWAPVRLTSEQALHATI